jgi:hypothetical protein
MRRIFWGFCRNWFLIDPLHYLSSRSDFGFEFAEIFVIEKRLPNSANWRIGDSPTRRVGESGFELFEKNGIYGHFCLKKIVSIGTLVDSPTRRVGESFFDYEYLRKFELKSERLET